MGPSSLFFPRAPGIGLESQRYHGHTGLAGQLDPDGVEVLGIEIRGAGTLGKDDDGDAFLQAFHPAFQDGRQVFTGIGAAHNDGIAGTHDGPEEGQGDQAFFHHERHGTVGPDDAGQHEGLQRAHVVGHEDAGAARGRDVLHAFDAHRAAHALDEFRHTQAGVDPGAIVTQAFGGPAAQPEHGASQQAAVES